MEQGINMLKEMHRDLGSILANNTDVPVNVIASINNVWRDLLVAITLFENTHEEIMCKQETAYDSDPAHMQLEQRVAYYLKGYLQSMKEIREYYKAP